MMATCHCSRCRKLGASAFVFIRRETFRWIAADVFEVDPGLRVRFHEVVAEKPLRVTIGDNVKQFAGHPMKD
jgi:hypothetical protein